MSADLARARYRAEADELDRRILALIEHPVPDEAGFEALALDVFAHQLRYNAPYAAYAQALGFTPERLPATWREIPAVPAAAFKEARLCTFAADDAALRFVTSGTTLGTGGTHYLESPALYDASLLAGFDAFMLPDGAHLRYLNLVPDPRERPTSSLGYMMATVARLRGDGADAFFLHGEQLDLDAFASALERARADGAAVCVAGTAFAFVALLDAVAASRRAFALLPGSRVMETGGFKGRTRRVERGELYSALARCFAIDASAIVAEYGMTELCGQYYDTVASRAGGTRVKAAGPWLRATIVDADGREVPAGHVGALRHVDLSNRSSIVAIETEDLAYACDDGFVLLGRDEAAELRGCSLDAEDLLARR